MKILKIMVGTDNINALSSLIRNGYILCESKEELKTVFKHHKNAVVVKDTLLRHQRVLWASLAPNEYIIDALYLKGSKGVIEIPTELEGFDSVRFL